MLDQKVVSWWRSWTEIIPWYFYSIHFWHLNDVFITCGFVFLSIHNVWQKLWLKFLSQNKTYVFTENNSIVNNTEKNGNIALSYWKIFIEFTWFCFLSMSVRYDTLLFLDSKMYSVYRKQLEKLPWPMISITWVYW